MEIRETANGMTDTFNHFAVTEENRRAFEAALRFTEREHHMPLCIFGADGTGKTHLLHAVRNRIMENEPETAVRLINAADLDRTVIDAIVQEQRLVTPPECFTGTDVLLIDDIQALESKEQTKRAFIMLFRSLYDAGTRIMMTASCGQNNAAVSALFREGCLFGEYAVIGKPYREAKAGGFVNEGIAELYPYLSRRSSLVLLAARPGFGSMKLAANIAHFAQERHGLKAVIFESELTEADFRYHLLPQSIDVRIEAIHAPTVSQIRERLYQLKDTDLVVISYFQLIAHESADMNRILQLEDIANELKALAAELNITILLLSQLPREIERRADHRPVLNDLRYYGTIEQAADVILFLYSDYYYHRESYERCGSDYVPITECIIAKNRFGEKGSIRLPYVLR